MRVKAPSKRGGWGLGAKTTCDANNKNLNKMYESSPVRFQAVCKVLPSGYVSCYCCIFLASPHKSILIVWLLEGHFVCGESFD